MQRTKTYKTPDLICTGDWHLRENIPLCRIDDFQKAQWGKVQFVKDLQVKYNCPVIHSGDLFDIWKPSPWLLSKAIQHLPDKFYSIFGNHDLPQHSLDLQDKSGIYNLNQAGKLRILNGVHWGQDPDEFDGEAGWFGGSEMLVYHVMAYQGKKPWPGCTDPMGAKLLRKYPQYKFILLGHNHKPFTETHEGRLLVNPGSLMRQESDQMDFKPRVYLYYADTNTVEPVYLPIEQGVVTRGHIEVKEERDDRINAFISKLETDFEAGLDFKDNLEQFFQTNRVRKIVKELVYKSMES